MARTLMAGVCALAMLGSSTAFAAKAMRCATSTEVTAIQAQVVQQQLMVAALTCGQIANFNAFQTTFQREMLTADNALMRMFQRLNGRGKGTAAYHLFKTNLANNFSIRSIRGNQQYCSNVAPMFAAALAPDKPSLREFVGGVQVASAETPVQSCDMTVATNLSGVQAAVVVPKPNPRWVADPNQASITPFDGPKVPAYPQ